VIAPANPLPDDSALALGLELVAIAVAAKVASDIGCPRLAIDAARQARRIAEQMVIALSPLLAATRPEIEDERLGDVRCSADVAAMLRSGLDRGEAT
jgi:hypothetical protein